MPKIIRSSNLSLINTLTANDIAKLNAYGIFELEEIAQLNEVKIEQLTKALRLLEGRIQYEYWVEQATDLLQEIN